MGVQCLVPKCGHYSAKNKCQYFRIPLDVKVVSTWKKLLNISSGLIKSKVNPRVCSCHFPNGKKENLKIAKDLRDSPLKHMLENISTASSSASSMPNVVDITSEPSSSVSVATVCKTTPIFKTSYVPSVSVLKPLQERQLQGEIEKLKNDIEFLEKKMLTVNLRFEMKFIENSDEKVYLHTGLPSKAMFDVVFRILTKVNFSYNQNWNVLVIPKRDQFLLTLMKLKMNLKHYDLAQRFGCSIATVSNIFRTWVLAMHEILFKLLMCKIPSRRKNQCTAPSVFKPFLACRIVLDTTTFFSDKPHNMKLQRNTFSAYKHLNAWKALIGVAPNGVITYLSMLYPGSLSDQAIVKHSEITKQLILGDLVLADKGFLIKDIV